MRPSRGPSPVRPTGLPTYSVLYSFVLRLDLQETPARTGLLVSLTRLRPSTYSRRKSVSPNARSLLDSVLVALTRRAATPVSLGVYPRFVTRCTLDPRPVAFLVWFGKEGISGLVGGLTRPSFTEGTEGVGGLER